MRHWPSWRQQTPDRRYGATCAPRESGCREQGFLTSAPPSGRSSSGQICPENGEWSGTSQTILECDLPEVVVCDVEITLADSEAIRQGQPLGSAYEEARFYSLCGGIRVESNDGAVFEIAAVKRPMLAHDQTAGQFGRAEVLHLARQLDGGQPDVDQGTCWRPPIVVMGQRPVVACNHRSSPVLDSGR
jgi:hypothetical protein